MLYLMALRCFYLTAQAYLCRLKTVELGRTQRAFWDFFRASGPAANKN